MQSRSSSARWSWRLRMRRRTIGWRAITTASGKHEAAQAEREKHAQLVKAQEPVR